MKTFRKNGSLRCAIVPNLLRKPKAMSYTSILIDLLQRADECSIKKRIDVFGVGGTATWIQTAFCSASTPWTPVGWRNRAARGIVQLPGSGERLVAGTW